jgi:hypothetical protein
MKICEQNPYYTVFWSTVALYDKLPQVVVTVLGFDCYLQITARQVKLFAMGTFLLAIIFVSEVKVSIKTFWVLLWLVTFRERACLSLHWVWPQRPIQLRGDAAAGEKSGWTPQGPTPWCFLSFHHTPSWLADSPCNRLHPSSWLPTQGH